MAFNLFYVFLCVFIHNFILSIIKSRKRQRYISYVSDVSDAFEPFRQTDFVNIKDAIKYVFKKKGIKNRKDLENWCGERDREALYTEVKKVTKITWLMEDDPKHIVRRIYEGLLPGYTNARVKSS